MTPIPYVRILWTVACQAFYPWNSPGKYSGVGSHSLLQGIFPTQSQNPGLLHCRQILYDVSHQGSPLGENGYTYMYDCVPSCFTWNCHKIINQLLKEMGYQTT